MSPRQASIQKEEKDLAIKLMDRMTKLSPLLKNLEKNRPDKLSDILLQVLFNHKLDNNSSFAATNRRNETLNHAVDIGTLENPHVITDEVDIEEALTSRFISLEGLSTMFKEVAKIKGAKR